MFATKILTSTPWPSLTAGEAHQIPQSNINVKKRAQALNETLLDELVESIERDGLQTPIVVRHRPDGYELVSGYHRLVAYQRLWQKYGMESKVCYNLIPAIVMGEEMTDDEAALWELVENVKRRQMDAKERSAYATRIYELRGKVWKEKAVRANGPNSAVSPSGTNSAVSPSGTNSRPKPKGGPKADPWFSTWHNGAGMSKQTAHNHWNRFKTETGQADVTSGSPEGAALKEQFFAWTKAEEDKRVEDAAEAARKTAAENAAKDKAKRKSTLLAAIRAVVDEDGQADALNICREAFPDLKINAVPDPSKTA